MGSIWAVSFASICRGGRWVHLGSLGSLSRALVVVGFRWGHWIHSRAPQGFLGSSRVVVFTLQRPGVYPRSLGSLASSLRILGFILRRWVHSSSPLVSFGSSWVVAFTLACAGGRWVHPGSFGSLACALCVVGFIRWRWVHSRTFWVSLGVVGFASERLEGRWFMQGVLRPLRVFEFIRSRLFHSRASWVSLASSAVVLYSRVRPRVVVYNLGPWVHSRVLWRSMGTFRAIGITHVHRWACYVHLGSFRLLAGTLVVVGFTPTLPGTRWVHPGSLGSLVSPGVDGFILRLCARSSAPWACYGSS